MKIDVNQLAAHFAHIPFQVQGVYRYARNPGVPHADYTDAFPGFVFPLTGKVQILMARPISFPREKWCMAAQK